MYAFSNSLKYQITRTRRKQSFSQLVEDSVDLKYIKGYIYCKSNKNFQISKERST